MTLVTGRIRDSGGVLLSGILRVTLDAVMVDRGDAPDAVLTTESSDFAISNGSVNINLVESASKNLTYRFEFLETSTIAQYFLADGNLYSGPKHYYSDNNWYTGAAHTPDSELLFEQLETRTKTLLDFHALVPNQAEVEFADLLPSGASTDILDTSLRRLAEILTSNVDYVELLRGGPRFRGEYVSTTYYQLNDSVSYGGSSWLWLNPSPGVGSVPTAANPNWQLIAAKGDAGSPAGQDTPYDPNGWDGAMWTPTANAIRDRLEQLAPLASPDFTGTPKAPLQLLTDETDAIANTLYVANKIAERLAAVTFPTQALTNSTQLPATTEFVKLATTRMIQLRHQEAAGVNAGSSVAGWQRRKVNTAVIQTPSFLGFVGADVFTLQAGTYWCEAWAPAYSAGRSAIDLANSDRSTTFIFGMNDFAVDISPPSYIKLRLAGRLALAAPTDLAIWHYVTTPVASAGLGFAASIPGRAEFYTVVNIWQLN